ncbi:MAG TPA: NAD(P)/FAD-dependent oxidoreductase [Chthoniobacterales bacterium]|nr:NAD(P)/FAD-dependent oxidoreductase [Chthoniobacterales bacterium]
MEIVDVAIVGGGPAGSTCAAFCAAAGLRVVLIEREKFPREKVCGDCINPACISVLQRLGLTEQIHSWPHAVVDAVDFVTIGGRKVRANFPTGSARMLTIKRSVLDDRLFSRARELRAQIHQETTVVSLHKTRDRDWKIDIVRDTFLARILVGADGRNSTVARLCNLLPRPERERIALQAHVPLPRDFGNRIVLQFLPEGYSGQAPVNERELNLCLVGTASTIASLRAWAEKEFTLPPNQQWRTITPLTRAPIAPAHNNNLFFIGDAARVVEPFTGEGIYYALRSGQLAANAIIKIIRGDERQLVGNEFARAHSAMYRGRLWINQLAREAVLHPRVASRLIGAAALSAPILRWLTRKIVKSIGALL